MTDIIIVLILSCLVLNCKSEHISEVEKKEIIAQLDAILDIDLEYAGLRAKTLTDTHGFKKEWELFKGQRDYCS